MFSPCSFGILKGPNNVQVQEYKAKVGAWETNNISIQGLSYHDYHILR